MACPIQFQHLPQGEWCVFSGLSRDVTAQSLCEFLCAKGLNITADRICIDHPKHCKPFAVVSFPRAEFAFLVNWAIGEDSTLCGRKLEAQPYGRTNRYAPEEKV